jgi:hypothetical protein
MASVPPASEPSLWAGPPGGSVDARAVAAVQLGVSRHPMSISSKYPLQPVRARGIPGRTLHPAGMHIRVRVVTVLRPVRALPTGRVPVAVPVPVVARLRGLVSEISVSSTMTQKKWQRRSMFIEA